MTNEFELSDEQLAEVSGAGSTFNALSLQPILAPRPIL